MLRLLSLAGFATMLAPTTDAAVLLTHHYGLGETNTLVSGRAQDSVGTAHFANANQGGFTVGAGTVEAPGSTAYSNLPAGTPFEGNYGINGSQLLLPASVDNFAVSIWVRTATTQTADFLQFNGTNNGSLKLGMSGGNWIASYHNIASFGGSTPAVLNDWTQIAAIRYSGVTTLYIDGVAVGGTTTATPTQIASTTGGVHIGVQSSGGNGFGGDLDELKIHTFDPLSDSLASVQAAVLVPEPAIALLGGLGLLALLRRRRD